MACAGIETPKLIRGIKTTLAVLSVLLALVAPVSADYAPLVPLTGATLEQMLANINAKQRVRIDDVTIARFRFLIAELHNASGEPRERVGDMLVRAHRMLIEDYGKSITLLEFAEMAYREREALSYLKDLPRLLTNLVMSTGRR
jgi:hypothetical protein